MTSARGIGAALTRGTVPGHHADVYVVGLVIVAAIVDWLVHTIAVSLTQAYIVPSLERARRESTSDSAARDYTRGLALARFVGAVSEALAVFATCSYYAQNNTPVWPAWAVFAAFFAALHLPRLLAASASFAGFRRSAA
jgi:hypothetical protein